MSIKNLSVTAASNNAAAPNGAPEGMTIASVNDTMRQIFAEIRTLAAADTIAAAATTDIGTKDATFLTLTGAVVTITALGTVSAGIYKAIIYNAAHVLTHNATSLILLSGANRTVVAGNVSLMLSEGSGNWRELFYGSAAAVDALAKTGGNLTGGINDARGNITQHATTMDLFAVTSPGILDGTGAAVTITACVNAPQAGATRKFYPIVATVLTHGATFDIVGNANLTAAAGDCWVIEAKTVSTYRAYAVKEDGTAVVATTTSAASTAEVKTGTEAAKYIAPDKLLAAVGFSGRYNSGNQTITAAGALTLAHSLGREPTLVMAWLKCLTGENGYSTGDKIYAPMALVDNSGASLACSIISNSTNLVVRFGTRATGTFLGGNATTGALVYLTNANWALVLDAWA